jgi:hypothetical protein
MYVCDVTESPVTLKSTREDCHVTTPAAMYRQIPGPSVVSHKLRDLRPGIGGYSRSRGRLTNLGTWIELLRAYS